MKSLLQDEEVRLITEQTQPAATEGVTPFISRSEAVNEIREKVTLIASSRAPVLLTGESGTGKEVVARMIHHSGGPGGRPFIAVNCAALPREMIDNELYGHEKEAFTGAFSTKSGCFELAEGGTLFLDEIAEMHPRSQAKLLRAIEMKSFRRLGGRKDLHVDVRIITATNRDISSSIATGDLREDLYYRLSVIELHLPPLRERKEDIPLLAEYFFSLFAEKYGTPLKHFTQQCLGELERQDWPGNVREFKNFVERTVLLCPDETVNSGYMPRRAATPEKPSNSILIPPGSTLEQAKRIVVQQTLEASGNNKSDAARILGISRKTLYEILERGGA